MIQDGILAAIIPDTHFFLTTVNSDVLYQPPLGHFRQIAIRDNGLYGADDPLCWPQFLDSENYPHLPCNPLKPRGPQDPYYQNRVIFMYDQLSEGDIDWVYHNQYRTSRGRLGKTCADLFAHSIKILKDSFTTARSVQLLDAPGKTHRRQYINSHVANMDRAFGFVTCTDVTFSDLRRGVVEICRIWLNLAAWMDYMQDFRTLISKPLYWTSPPPAKHVRGCFTDDVAKASGLVGAGIPVFLMQPKHTFSTQNILKVDQLLPIKVEVHQELVVRQNQIVYKGRNGTKEHFDAISEATKRYCSFPLPLLAADPQPEKESIFTVGPTLGSIVRPTVFSQRDAGGGGGSSSLESSPSFTPKNNGELTLYKYCTQHSH